LRFGGGGSILHDFYTGIEKIFEDIAKEIGRRLPAFEAFFQAIRDVLKGPENGQAKGRVKGSRG
jgi:hypothetical protein